MVSNDIKSGSEVVSEFLAALQGDKAIDADTLAAVHDLFAASKLSRNRLLAALETLRESSAKEGGDEAADRDTVSDD